MELEMIGEEELVLSELVAVRSAAGRKAAEV